MTKHFMVAKVIAKQILIDGTVGTPEAERDLDRTLEEYSAKGGQAFGGLSAIK